jgi:hypothetical protein
VLLIGNDHTPSRSDRKLSAKLDEACKRYNAGTCNMGAESCRYKHSCSLCGGAGHRAKDCGKKKA